MLTSCDLLCWSALLKKRCGTSTGTYVESSGEHEKSGLGHARCELFQQKIGCGSAMSTRFRFCSQHSRSPSVA
jgi:hypothetical protein